MKFTFAMVALTLSALVSEASTVCYQTQDAISAYTPKSICVRAIDIAQNQGSVTINTDLEDTNTKAMNVTSFVRHNEEKAYFTATVELAGGRSGWNPACSEADTNVAIIKGIVDTRNNPEIDLSSLSVSVDFYSVSDVCHPSVEEHATYNYNVIK